MKRTAKLLFSSLGVLALAFASCSSDENLMTPDNSTGEVYGVGKKVITINVNPESGTVGTRAFEGLDLGHISDGKKADVLYFTVYKKATAADETAYAVAPEFKKGTDATLGVGQNKLDVTSWPLTIQLALEENYDYKIAFWAQNKDCNAFNVSDLKNVQVKYENAKNNDELRDAFCAVSNPITSTTESEHIVLRRPFAQINVGTSGADYKNMLQGPRVFPNRTFIYSQVEVKGAYDQINVLTDEISQSQTLQNAGGVVTFAWNIIPAYFNYKDTDIQGITSFLKDDNEEFLKVKLNDNTDAPLGYLESYPTRDEDGTYKTETFKYMSMCYVLVPAETKTPETGANPYDKYQSSTLSSVKVKFAETLVGTEGKDYLANAEGTKEATGTPKTYVDITNVPVHRNWRTNIIGGLSNTTDSEDPTGPDDPTSLFNFVKLCIHQDPIYFGEYYNVNKTPNILHPSGLEWVSNAFSGDANLDNNGEVDGTHTGQTTIPPYEE